MRRFIVRLVGNRNVVHRGELNMASAVATRCPMHFAEGVVREENGKEKRYHVEYGFVRVSLPEVADRGDDPVQIQSYDIENVRLLTYARLQNMMVLVLCAMYFAAVCIGGGVQLGVLAHYALEEAQRFYGIPNFRYYALAVGLGKFLRGSTRPFAGRKEPLLQEMQLSLLGP